MHILIFNPALSLHPIRKTRIIWQHYTTHTYIWDILFIKIPKMYYIHPKYQRAQENNLNVQLM